MVEEETYKEQRNKAEGANLNDYLGWKISEARCESSSSFGIMKIFQTIHTMRRLYPYHG